MLANGPGGWVQTANFVVTALLVLAAAVGFARAVGHLVRVVGCAWLAILSLRLGGVAAS